MSVQVVGVVMLWMLLKSSVLSLLNEVLPFARQLRVKLLQVFHRQRLVCRGRGGDQKDGQEHSRGSHF